MINGFVVIDKPAGITSHDVVSRVRRILGTRKVGHTGTLDPFATGVLPVAVNEGTKAIPFLDEGSKTYEALLRLGVTTDTLDMTGVIMSEADSSRITREQFVSCLRAFTGVIRQTPPMFSAIKQNGQPLYKLARQGVEVDRKARDIEIHSLELLSFERPLAAIRVVCSRGTYVRSLADDIGRQLGCGAALQELRRTASGPFVLSKAHTLEALQEAESDGRSAELCVSPCMALANLVDYPLTEAGLAKVFHGRSPDWSEIGLDESPVVDGTSLVRLTFKDKLVAVAELVPESNAGLRMILKRVFN